MFNKNSSCFMFVQIIFDNILNRKIPWPAVPDDMSYEAKDLIDRFVCNLRIPSLSIPLDFTGELRFVLRALTFL